MKPIPAAPGETNDGFNANWLRLVALWGLCAAYLQGAYEKISNFSGALAEMQHFGLMPAAPLAVVVILIELLGSAMVLTGFYRYVGALTLAGFTLASSFIANRFWEVGPPARFPLENAFFEHLGLVGGLLLVAWLDLRTRTRP